MKVEIKSGGGGGFEGVMDVTSVELAALWQSGARVQPAITATERDKARFVEADTLIACIDLRSVKLEAVLSASFTRKYASAAIYWGGNEGGGMLLLAFALPRPVTVGREYQQLLKGLQALYAGSVAMRADQDYGISGNDLRSVTWQNVLDDEGYNHLVRLGEQSTKVAALQGAYLRSHIHVGITTAIVLDHGQRSCLLGDLEDGMRVFCPVHVDDNPTGIVRRYEGGWIGVQCSHCKCTYATPRARNQYDFDQFDRVIGSLAAAGADQPVFKEGALVEGLMAQEPDIHRLREQYLPPITLQEGVTFVKSPKGTGKTTALIDLVKQCKKNHNNVLLLGHRRSLLQQMAQTLGLDCYFEVSEAAPSSSDGNESTSATGVVLGKDEVLGETTNVRFRAVAPTNYYAVCLDSMERLDPGDKDRQYPIVIIDESEQVFAHLVGSTMAPQRRAIFARIEYYLVAPEQPPRPA